MGQWCSATVRLVLAIATVTALSLGPALASGRDPNGQGGQWPSAGTGRAATSGSWGANVKINNEQTGSVQQVPGLAIDGRGLVYSAWAEASGGGKDLYVSKSTDRGKGWVGLGRLNEQ